MEDFKFKMEITPQMFASVMSEDAVKQHFKRTMANELAIKLIDSKKTKFIHQYDRHRDVYILSAELKI